MLNVIDTTKYYRQPELAELAQNTNLLAAAKGVQVSRWVANGGLVKSTITYAVHTGERANQARQQRGVQFQDAATYREYHHHKEEPQLLAVRRFLNLLPDVAKDHEQ